MDPRFHFEWTYPWVVLVGMVIGYLVTSLPGTSGSETSLAIGIAAAVPSSFEQSSGGTGGLKHPRRAGRDPLWRGNTSMDRNQVHTREIDVILPLADRVVDRSAHPHGSVFG